MKSSLLLTALLSLILLSSCQPSKNQALELVESSVKSHGGQDTWENLKGFEVEKIVTHQGLAGEEEVVNTYKLQFRLTPFFEGNMQWEKDNIFHQVSFDGLKTRYMMGSNEILNEGFLANKQGELLSNFQAVSGPFALLENNFNLTYEGIISLPDGRTVESIQATSSSPSNTSTIITWYFLDPETKKLLAQKVKKAGAYMLINNIKSDRFFGVDFPTRQEIYETDSIGTILQLQSVHEFINYKLID